MTGTNDNNLVQQCLQGDARAFEVLVDNYKEPVFNIAFHMTNDQEESEVITKSVFNKAFKQLSTFDSRYTFFSWIYRISIDETIHYLNRKQQVEQQDNQNRFAENTSNSPYNAMKMGKAIQTALMDINVWDRAVIVLKHFLNCSYQEIAFIMGIPERKVKSGLQDAQQLMKRILISNGVVAYD